MKSVFNKYTQEETQPINFRLVPNTDAKLLAYEMLHGDPEVVESLRESSDSVTAMVLRSPYLFEQEVIVIAHNKSDMYTALTALNGNKESSTFSIGLSRCEVFDIKGAYNYVISLYKSDMTMSMPAYIVAQCDTDLKAIIDKMMTLQ